jgi:hypothetical protein
MASASLTPWSPAYAATIHTSQGSEYPAVVIPVLTQHYAMLQRNLLYTSITRGKRLVVLVGQKKAIAIAVRNVRVGDAGRSSTSGFGSMRRGQPPMQRKQDEAPLQRSKTAIRRILSLRRG